MAAPTSSTYAQQARHFHSDVDELCDAVDATGADDPDALRAVLAFTVVALEDLSFAGDVVRRLQRAAIEARMNRDEPDEARAHWQRLGEWHVEQAAKDTV